MVQLNEMGRRMKEKRAVRMGPITRMLVAHFASRYDDEPGSKRAAYGLLGGYVSTVVNTVLAVVKLGLGIVTGSIGIIADAVHTFSDSLTSVVLIAGSYMARQPPDKEHPFGHGRAESVATMVIAVLLSVAGFEFGKVGVERFFSPTPVTASWWVVGALCLTIVVKEWMSRFSRALARDSGNTALDADFWHHRSDAISTALVVVGVVAGQYGWPQVDALAGIGVAIFLFYVAFTVARDAIHPLVGAAPAPEEVRQVKDLALSVDGVRGVHEVVIHRYGDVRFVSLHVETSDERTSGEIHTITHAVERLVAAETRGSVCVHPDPVNSSHPVYARVQELVELMVAREADLISYHDLRIVGSGEEMYVIVEVKPSPETDSAIEATIRLEVGLKSVFPNAEMVVEVEPTFSY
jgi:cation diffusion facilitator family transporter